MSNIKVGFSKKIITPPIGTPLSGYEFERYAKGINDDLYVRVIAFTDDHNNEKLFFIQLDLIAVDYNFVDLLISQITEKFKIKKSNVEISCIHTHSGPGGTMDTDNGINRAFKYVFCNYNHNLVQYITDQTIKCIKESLNGTDYFTVSYGESYVDGVSSNRRDRNIPIDKRIQVVKITRKDKKIAIIYNFACHPTVLNKFNYLISSDFAGEVSKLMEQRKHIELTIFYNGACGDISTRFIRKESSFKESRRLAYIIASNIIKSLNNNISEFEVDNIYVINNTLPLKIKQVISIEQAQKIVEENKIRLQNAINNNINGNQIRLYQSELEGAINNLHLSEAVGSIKTIDINISIVRLGDIILVYIPGELFNSLGTRIKQAFNKNKILIICYSNGYIGYIPDAKAYSLEGYEVASSLLPVGCGEQITDEVIEMINNIRTK